MSNPDDKTPPGNKKALENAPTGAAADEIDNGLGANGEKLLGETVLGRYRVVGLIGKGGYGFVYAAQDLELERQVALKILRLKANESVSERFRLEAKAIAKLNHPAIATLYDASIGEAALDKRAVMVMELLEGRSLRDELMTGKRFPWREAFGLVAQAAEALALAHSHRIIHRDLKPDNLFLSVRPTGPGRPPLIWLKVLDFGIAKLIEEFTGSNSSKPRKRLTNENELPGTPSYMSPEQMRNEELDGRTDVYSLGAVLYNMVSARRLWPPKMTFDELRLRVLNEKPKDIRHHLPEDELPEYAAEVIRRAIDPVREKRFQSMHAFQAALVSAVATSDEETTAIEVLDGEPTTTGSAPVIEIVAPPRKRWIRFGAALLALALVAGAAFATITGLQRRARKSAETPPAAGSNERPTPSQPPAAVAPTVAPAAAEPSTSLPSAAPSVPMPAPAAVTTGTTVRGPLDDRPKARPSHARKVRQGPAASKPNAEDATYNPFEGE